MTNVNYEYFGCRLHEVRPPVTEGNLYSTFEGFVEITTPGILEGYTVEPELYKLIVPTYTEPRYIRSGSNLYTEENLFYNSAILESGSLSIFYRLDPYNIPGSENDDYYGITFFVNRARDARYVKVASDVVIHIVNQFKDV